MAMSVILLMPVFLSDQVSTEAYIPNMQIVLSGVFIVVGICVWLWGSKSQLLKLIIFYSIIATAVLILALMSLLFNLSSFNSNEALILMKDALVIWTMTVLTFSLWYWLLDSGWSEKQGAQDTDRQDFLFPQQNNNIQAWQNWEPSYTEYLYLAFNTNTAFSPTDVMPLSHRVKALMMVQSSLALVIISTVAAQSINILSG